MAEETTTTLPGMEPEEKVRALRPRPPELPAVIEDWQRFLVVERSINDHVEDVHRQLIQDKEDGKHYLAYLYACWDEQAVEGSLSCDNVMAAQMIRNWAVEHDDAHPLGREKLSTISKSLGVVLRRYRASRKERRLLVSGEVVSEDNNNQ